MEKTNKAQHVEKQNFDPFLPAIRGSLAIDLAPRPNVANDDVIVAPKKSPHLVVMSCGLDREAMTFRPIPSPYLPQQAASAYTAVWPSPYMKLIVGVGFTGGFLVCILLASISFLMSNL